MLLSELTVKRGVNVTPADLGILLPAVEKDRKKDKFLKKGDGWNMYFQPHSVHPVIYLRGDDDKIIGLFSATKKYFYYPKKTSRYEVVIVWVARAWRGKGLGTLLYKEAIKQLRGIVSSDNMGIMAMRIWKRLAQDYKVRVYDWDTEDFVDHKWSRVIPTVNGKPITDEDKEYQLVLDEE